MTDDAAVCLCRHAYWLHEGLNGRCKLPSCECDCWTNSSGKAHKYASFVKLNPNGNPAGRIASSTELKRPVHMRRYEYV